MTKSKNELFRIEKVPKEINSESSIGSDISQISKLKYFPRLKKSQRIFKIDRKKVRGKQEMLSESYITYGKQQIIEKTKELKSAI